MRKTSHEYVLYVSTAAVVQPSHDYGGGDDRKSLKTDLSKTSDVIADMTLT